ncbi:MAG: pyridoxal-phosphate dependent enzyme, partial [Candidatus Micrarchaeia archaeon]
MAVEVVIKCVNCARAHNTKSPFVCDCGGLLDVSFNVNETNATKKLFDKRLHEKKFPNSSGVWRFREIVHPLARDKDIVSRPEGNTNSYCHEKLSEFTGVKKLFAKHEGENPSGSFKDRGITVGITEANRLKAKTVACASTGNTSASLASYAAISGKKSVVFVPQGNIAVGKLAQALAFNATVLQVKGNFDQAMRMVQESATNLGMYLLNSINPWRLEGQKTIVFDLIQQLE